MSDRKRLLVLVVIMMVVALIVGGVAIWIPYQTAFEEQRARLMETVQSHARLMEAMNRYDQSHQSGLSTKAMAATIAQVKDAHTHMKGLGKTGEFVLARREGEWMVFLLRHRHFDLDQPKPVPFHATLAEPMRRALSGQSGTVVGFDYRGVSVLAAHEPVANLNLGIVAKIDLAEIHRPFLRAAGIVALIAIAVIGMGVLIFRRITNAIIQKLQENAKALRIAKDTLEQQVKERTIKLFATNQTLKKEIKERTRATGEIQSLARFPDENTNPILRADEKGVILYANTASAPLLKAWDADVGRGLPAEWVDWISKTLQSGQDQERDFSTEQRIFSVHLVPIADVGYVNLYGSDITDRVRAEGEVNSLARFPEENTNPVLRVGRDGVVLYANVASGPLLDRWETKIHQKLPPEWSALVQDVLRTGSDKEVETPVDNRIFSVRMAPVLEVGYVNLYGADITERKAYEDQLRHLANYDKLTGLPNRTLFQDRLQRTMGLSQKDGTMSAILLVGVDGFREINQELGREAVDAVRKAIAQRLLAGVPDTATVASFSGDVFAIIHSGIEQISGAADIAQRVLTTLAEPFQVDDDAMEIHASVGITLFPSDSEDPDRLLHLADLAMFRAKGDPRRNSYRFYEGGMNEVIQERRNLLRDLKWAIESDHLEIHYQPQISLTDNRLVGMEALLRWRHPEKGLISPGRFIPLAEETRLIVPIGLWVLQSACNQNKQWQDAGLPPLKVAVNLSSVQFGEPDLVQEVASAIRESRLDPQFLELEITESVAMEGAEKTAATLEALHDLGLSISIDDFGTGYSSLSYLKRFPVAKVKIDQSFVRDLENDSESAALCNAIIQLGHSLNLQVIAEGVETAEQLRQIRGLGCDQVQGYYYSRPLDVEAFARFVRQWKS